MHFKYRNINDAFKDLVEGIHTKRIPTRVRDSRNGPVLQIEEPVIITYEKPRERVLFNKGRDCNPFFHLFESLWMLAGRNDVAPLRYFNSNIANYSDDGETFNGSYGYRWRSHLPNWKPKPYMEKTGTSNAEFDTNLAGHKVFKDYDSIDQLDVLIKHLQEKPESRRAVLQMWNVEDDLLKVDTSRDVACNLSVLFSIREDKNLHGWDPDKLMRKIDQEYEMAGLARKDGDMLDSERRMKKIKEYRDGYDGVTTYLDMTVFNRSNDMIWGALGANYCHMGFLQEYMACSLGVEVGVYNQVTNNLHCYLDKWKPEEWIENRSMLDEKALSYDSVKVGPKLFDAPGERTKFDEECKRFVGLFSGGDVNQINVRAFWDRTGHDMKFFDLTVCPTIIAFLMRKVDYNDAVDTLDCASEDWALAGLNWLSKRRKGNAS